MRPALIRKTRPDKKQNQIKKRTLLTSKAQYLFLKEKKLNKKSENSVKLNLN